jgi:hypothetical protein
VLASLPSPPPVLPTTSVRSVGMFLAKGAVTVARILRVWRLVRPDRSVLRVRLVSVDRGVRLEVQAGRGQMAVACARYVDGRWVVRMPFGRRTVRAASWAVALHWMTQELHSVLPGRLVRLGPSSSSGPDEAPTGPTG